MVARFTALKILAKMAICGGARTAEDLSIEEREFLIDFIRKEGRDIELEALMAQAIDAEFGVLVASVKERKDGFFITMRAYFLAQANHKFTEAQKVFYEQLIQAFKISNEDRKCIESNYSSHRGSEPKEVENSSSAIIQRQFMRETSRQAPSSQFRSSIA